ncbi:MAG: hypothetical protein ABIN04_01700, partial [Ginsengibacter sp.]
LGAIGTGWHTTSNSSPRTSPANTLSWDGVPGGTQDVERGGSLSQSGTVQSIGKENSFFGNVWRGVVGSLLLNIDYNITFPFAQKIFSFVAITSSLDVQNVTSATFNQQFIYPINGLNGSRAGKYIAQELSNGFYNISHTDFTARNSKWIYNEMQGITQTYNCDDYCQDNMSISGTNQICTSALYKINNLPAGSTVTWSASPSSLIQFSCTSCSQTTVTEQGSGTVTITATVMNSCGNFPVIKSNIRVGAPPISSYTVVGAGTVYASAGYAYSVTYPWGTPAPENINWRVPAGWTIVNGQGTEYINIWTGSTGGFVQVDFDNACGGRTGTFKTVVIGTGGPDPQVVDPSTTKLAISPNPATNDVVISLLSNETKTGSGVSNFISEIKVIDKMGTIKKQFVFSNKKTSQLINIAGLRADTYVIQAFTGNQWLSGQLLILNN